MANEKNIEKYQIKKGELSKEEASRRGSLGGKASGEARRKNKLLKDEILRLMSEDDWNKMCRKAIARAMESDDAFKTLRDTIGQKPVDKVDATIDAVVIDVTLNEDEG